MIKFYIYIYNSSMNSGIIFLYGIILPQRKNVLNLAKVRTFYKKVNLVACTNSSIVVLEDTQRKRNKPSHIYVDYMKQYDVQI